MYSQNSRVFKTRTNHVTMCLMFSLFTFVLRVSDVLTIALTDALVNALVGLNLLS